MPVDNSKFSQKVVTLGGGTGHFALLSGLVESNDPDGITAITGTWDSGGSSGRLRMELGVLPSGDIRQCLLALMEDGNQQQVAQKLFNDRLTGVEGPLKGHALGNLIESQLQRIYQGQDRGIDAARALFRVRAHIEPISLSDLELCAETKKGNVIEGETDIDLRGEKKNYDSSDGILRIYFDTTADPNPKALEAISQAEKIVFSAGDLYTSILPHLLVSGVANAIVDSKAKIIFVLNLMTKKGETDKYKASDFLKALLFYLGSPERLDYIIANENHISPEVIEVYKEEGKEPVTVDEEVCLKLAPKAKIIKTPLAKYFPGVHLLRHDSEKLAKSILSL
ncbi:YvcK family protein [Candidatus Daviesbacteria bacterium]|nr:YvcK family protein [Candidatus Daviesbacteria bacterium]